MMTFREAGVEDIPQIQVVRNSVKENVLSDPSLVTDDDCRDFMTRRGRGWVCEVEGRVVGFAVADLVDANIWALFVHPGFEHRGIGGRLHDMMMHWYFEQGKDNAWLSTSPGSRAVGFYLRKGWTQNGTTPKGEIRFEMNRSGWNLAQDF